MQVSDPPATPARTSPAPARTAPDGAHAIFEVLRDWGVDLLLTCPGSTEAAVLDASRENPDMRTILVTHESIAVAAADAYGRLTGKPAVAYLHANVGLANGVAHLSCAALTRSPVVVLNGIKSTVIGNRGGFTTAPYMTDHVRQYTTYAKVALRSDGIADDLTRALAAATADPGGPVYLGLPQDLVEAQTPLTLPDAKRRRVASRRRPDPAAVALAARAHCRPRRGRRGRDRDRERAGARGDRRIRRAYPSADPQRRPPHDRQRRRSGHHARLRRHLRSGASRRGRGRRGAVRGHAVVHRIRTAARARDSGARDHRARQRRPGGHRQGRERRYRHRLECRTDAGGPHRRRRRRD